MKLKQKMIGTAPSCCLIALLTVLTATVSHAQVGITMAINGFYGSNLSASGGELGDGAVVKLGFFHSGTAFIPTASVLSNWNDSAIQSTMQGRLTSLGLNFYTLAETTTLNLGEGNGAEFQILFSPDPEVQPNSAFQRLFNINPATAIPTLSGVNLIGYKPFVWIQTASGSEFGLFETKNPFPSGVFPDSDFTADVINTGATALVGTLLLNDAGVQLVPEPSTATLTLIGFGILSFLRRRDNALRS